MGRPRRPLPAKLITGLLWRDEKCFDAALRALRHSFGPEDFHSPVFAFDLTDYYTAEMGLDLKRTFLSFQRLIRAETLPAIKLKTNAVERRLALDGRRRVNIDPGYVSLGKLVLATTKNHSHRLYAGRGIFEEVTLVFRDGSFAPRAHTYPDYRQETHIGAFNTVRRLYTQQIASAYGRSALSQCP